MKREENTLVIYGDSISTGTHGEGGYETLLRESLGFKAVKNYAVGSSGLSYATPDNAASILEKEENQPKGADVILIWHGSNDWYWGSPIGALSDTGRGSFYGAIAACASNVRMAAPEGLLVWGNPLYRFETPCGGDVTGSAYMTKNRVGNTLFDYAKALEEAGAYHGFPVINMHGLTGIHERNQERFLEDNVHPNKEGYKRIHLVLHKEIARLMSMYGYYA